MTAAKNERQTGQAGATDTRDLHGKNIVGVAERRITARGTCYYVISAELDLRDSRNTDLGRDRRPHLTDELSRAASGKESGKRTHFALYSKGDGSRILSRSKCRAVGDSRWEFACKADLARESLLPTESIELLSVDPGPAKDSIRNLRILPNTVERSDFRLDGDTLKIQHAMMRQARDRHREAMAARRAEKEQARQAPSDVRLNLTRERGAIPQPVARETSASQFALSDDFSVTNDGFSYSSKF